MAFCKLLAALVLIHNPGGLLGAEVRNSIVGGGDAPRGRWPWMAHVNVSSDGIKKWRCGGTIVGDQWVLTAASCWNRERGAKPDRSMVWVGSHSLQHASARYMGIYNVIIHPYFQAVGNGYVNDLAMLKLKKKLKFSENVSQASLADVSDSFNSLSECWIIGWGDIQTGVPLPAPETLQEVKIPIIPQSVCRAKYPEVNDKMLCAGDMAGGKDACNGDYGGPLMCRAARGFVQMGIMSFGSRDGCGLPGRPGVYTKVSSYLQYIADTMKYNEEASAEV